MPFPPSTSYPIPILKDYGFLAVNFFFAISGFVVCLVAVKPNFRPLEFLFRRAFRLYPLWIITSLVFSRAAVLHRLLETSATAAANLVTRNSKVRQHRICLFTCDRELEIL